MGRIVHEIEVDGKKLNALFDTGSVRSYIRSEFRPPVTHKVRPLHVALGGRELILTERCDIIATIDGLEFAFTAYPIDEIGEVEEGRIDVLIGVLCMEEWYIKLDPKTGTLDLTGLRRREFTEFFLPGKSLY
jgi:hypothetical protein